MQKQTEEPGSRGNDQKKPGERDDNRGGNVSDGKDADVPQGGKRRGAGRWIQEEPPGD
jgi:hypothetical protein